MRDEATRMDRSFCPCHTRFEADAKALLYTENRDHALKKRGLCLYLALLEHLYMIASVVLGTISSTVTYTHHQPPTPTL